MDETEQRGSDPRCLPEIRMSSAFEMQREAGKQAQQDRSINSPCCGSLGAQKKRQADGCLDAKCPPEIDAAGEGELQIATEHAFLNEADKHAPLEVVIFNVGANVNFPILETTDRVFRKVWEMACWAGFVTGREAARLMVPRGHGNIFFTGATASLRGGAGFAAFASAKFGLRAVAQSMARELMPKNIHVAHLIIDSGVDTAWVRERREQMWGKEALDNPDLLMPPASVAGAYWQLYQQPRSAWTFEMEIRPFGEKW